ncbi:uncharacterized protein LOC110992598 [Pieris rapae]|uniref:uncharacterized protein LOC110992598 n=1 Tax=Pieris rapae TaxID=64459 RepID=UPI001E2817A6|nr:uncharacterized protein LOC110992598 [Pieris rapae]
MNKFCALLIVAFLSSVACRRLVRQTTDELDDRYGFNQQWQRPQNPWMRPNQPWMRPSDPWGRPMNPVDPFPNPFPNPNPIPTVPTPAPTQAPGGSTTESPDVLACQRNCPGTAEYNPVCGSNGKDYDNPGRLYCAQMCGISVTMLRQSKCPTTPAPTS